MHSDKTSPPWHRIQLTQADLYLELGSDDLPFIARQMNRWMALFADEQFQPMVIMPGLPGTPEPPIDTHAPDPIAAGQESPLTEPAIIDDAPLLTDSAPAPDPSGTHREAELLSQIRQLQQQVDILAHQALTPSLPEHSPAFSPEAIDAFVAPAHQDVQTPLAQDPLVNNTLSGFEQPVDNLSILAENSAISASSASLPEEPAGLPGPGKPEPLENQLSSASSPAMDMPSGTEEDFDKLLNTLMSDMTDQEETPDFPDPVAEALDEALIPEPELARAQTPNIPITEAPLDPVEQELADILTSEPALSPDMALPPSDETAQETAPAQHDETPTDFPKEDDALFLNPFMEIDSLPDDKAELSLPPSMTQQEQAPPLVLYDFGIPGLQDAPDDPNLKRLSLETLQAQPGAMRNYISPFPNASLLDDEEFTLPPPAPPPPPPIPSPPPPPPAPVQSPAPNVPDDADPFSFSGFSDSDEATPSEGTGVDMSLFGNLESSGSSPMDESDPFAVTDAPAFSAPPPIPQTETTQGEETEFEFETLEELCEAAPQSPNSQDALLLAAYFLEKANHCLQYPLKDLNTQLVRSQMTPVHHGIVEQAITNGQLELVPDLTGTSAAAEYRLTIAGRKHVRQLLEE